MHLLSKHVYVSVNTRNDSVWRSEKKLIMHVFSDRYILEERRDNSYEDY